MNRVIILHWCSADCRVLVLRGTGSQMDVEAVTDLPTSESPAEMGRQIAAAVASYAPQRTSLVVAVGRDLLQWQHLQLPPCPEEDLPDLVRLQSDYATNGTDDPSGLDFLPLAGSADQPHQLWSIALAPSRLTKLRQVLAATELSVKHVVPAALGWPQFANEPSGAEDGRIWVAPLGGEPVIWCTAHQRVVLFRQLTLPPADSPEFATAIANQVQRTEFAFRQQHPEINSTETYLVGTESPHLTSLGTDLSAQLDRKIEIPPCRMNVTHSQSPEAVAEPIIGLAAATIAGEKPAVDLVNPHAPPAPATRMQTYYLAAAAALALVALVGWQAYRGLQEPLDRAAEMQAEIDLIEETSGDLSQAEIEAAAIRTWLDNSVNLLTELRTISTHVRSEPLDSESFEVEDDIVIGKIELRNRQFTIDAYARENSDLQPVEYRLRDGKHRVRRGETSQATDVNGYPVKFTTIVDVSDNLQAEGGNP